MKPRAITSVTLFAAALAAAAVMPLHAASAAPTAASDMARVGPGTLSRFYPPTPAEAEVRVAAFRLDRVPVTNARFAAFVAESPQWRRDRVPRLFAEEGYLSQWATATEPGDAGGDAPVTRVSWFAARAFCAARGARLPTSDEWELAAAASETRADARTEPAFRQRVLDWYGRPTPATLPPVGRTAPNFWGVRDLHGLVWEWVLDFDATRVGGEEGNPFGSCGGGRVVAADTGDYATFMRMALRSSLRARSALASLGFRCAADEGASR